MEQCHCTLSFLDQACKVQSENKRFETWNKKIILFSIIVMMFREENMWDHKIGGLKKLGERV
jgi:hypothetical protein